MSLQCKEQVRRASQAQAASVCPPLRGHSSGAWRPRMCSTLCPVLCCSRGLLLHQMGRPYRLHDVEPLEGMYMMPVAQLSGLAAQKV